MLFLPYQRHTPHVPHVPEWSSPGKDIFFSHVLLHFSVASTPRAFHGYLAPFSHHPLHRKFAGISGLLELKAHFHWQSPALWSLFSEHSSPCCFEQQEHEVHVVSQDKAPVPMKWRDEVLTASQRVISHSQWKHYRSKGLLWHSVSLCMLTVQELTL